LTNIGPVRKVRQRRSLATLILRNFATSCSFPIPVSVCSGADGGLGRWFLDGWRFGQWLSFLAVLAFEFGDSFGDRNSVTVQTLFANPPAMLLVDRLRRPVYFVARVDAKHRLIARFFPLENAGAPFAFPTLTFLRDGREHFGCMEFVKLVDQNAIRDRLRQRLKDGGVDCSDDGSTLVALERYLFPVQFGHDAADASDTSAAMRNDGEMQRFGGHHFIVAPPRTQRIEQAEANGTILPAAARSVSPSEKLRKRFGQCFSEKGTHLRSVLHPTLVQ
jgi:hypothetical protein